MTYPIQPDNILLDGDRVLLADWGYAHTFTTERTCTIYNGTEGYWAPEVLFNQPFVGPEVDCWSLGVTLYAMASRRLPFNRQSDTYIQDLLRPNFVVPPAASPELRSLIVGLITPDPTLRMKIEGAPCVCVCVSDCGCGCVCVRVW